MKEKIPINTNHIVNKSLEGVIKPWSNLSLIDLTASQPISFSVLEISRRTGLSPNKVIDLCPRQLQTAGVVFEIGLEKPKLTPAIKRLIRGSVKEPPIKGIHNGGRCLNEGLLREKIKQERKKRIKIVFRATDLSRGDANRRRRDLIQAKKLRRWTIRGFDTETKPVLKALRQKLARVEGLLSLSPGIDRARWSHLDNLSLPSDGRRLRLAIEFCPLYTAGTTLAESRLDDDPENENSILRSRVGNKWAASKCAIEQVNEALGQVGIGLTVQAVFADIGVFSASNDGLNLNIINRHFELHRRLFEDFCRNLGIDLEFSRLSEIVPSDPSRAVSDLIVPDNNGSISFVDPEKLLDITHMREEVAHMGKAAIEKWKETLALLFKASSGKISVFKGLLNTYVGYDTVQKCNIWLAAERSDGLLALRSLISDLRGSKIPSLNILVK